MPALICTGFLYPPVYLHGVLRRAVKKRMRSGAEEDPYCKKTGENTYSCATTKGRAYEGTVKQ